MTANSRRKNYKNIVVFGYFTERKTASRSSMVSEGIAVLLHRIEIDLDEESSRGDSIYSSSVQSICHIFSKSFHQEWLAPLLLVLYLKRCL